MKKVYSSDTYDIGGIIRDAREKKNWSQKDLADKIGVSDNSVSRWECNASEPRMGISYKLMDALDLSPEELAPLWFRKKLDARGRKEDPETETFNEMLLIMNGEARQKLFWIMEQIIQNDSNRVK